MVSPVIGLESSSIKINWKEPSTPENSSSTHKELSYLVLWCKSADDAEDKVMSTRCRNRTISGNETTLESLVAGMRYNVTITSISFGGRQGKSLFFQIETSLFDRK